MQLGVIEAIYDWVLNPILGASAQFYELFSPSLSLNARESSGPKIYHCQAGPYIYVIGNTGDPALDKCTDSENEHRIGMVGPETFENSEGAATSNACVGCEKPLNYLRDNYDECVRCKEFCNSCTDTIIDSSVSNYILPLIIGDVPIFVLFSVVVQLLCNKTYRDILLIVYYIYKSKFKKSIRG